MHAPLAARAVDPRGRWWAFSGGANPLETLVREGSRADAVLDYVWTLPRVESQFVTVVVPEQFAAASLAQAVLHRTALTLKLRLLSEPGVAIANVPLLTREMPEPERAVCRVLASGVHAASLRACNYALSLGLDDTRAIFFAGDAEEARVARRDWEFEQVPLRFDVYEAPYRGPS